MQLGRKQVLISRRHLTHAMGDTLASRQSKALRETVKIIERCSECDICVKSCEFLTQLGETPKKLAEKFQAGFTRENPRVPYSCNLCDLCGKLCPEGLNIGKMCLEARQQLVKDGIAPLSSHIYIRREQEWTLSDSFALCLPDVRARSCSRVFFPGCHLSGYSPALVVSAYKYLRETLSDTGIILGCCGAPTKELGEELQFQQIVEGVALNMRKLGASEIIVACPHCYHNFKHYAAQFGLRSLYEVILEFGLPKIEKTGEWTFSLHDSCKARCEERFQQAVRTLVRNLGYWIEEMEYSRDKTRCCGAGGGVSYIDFDLQRRITKRRANEASFDLLTYCGACREIFAAVKPSIHVLDLVFNPNWMQDRLKPPNKASVRRENQGLLKSLLQRKITAF